MRKRLGIVTPTISPFKKGSIDSEAVSALVSFLKRIKVYGIFPCGTSGCAPLMDVQQHISVMKAYSDARLGKMKLFSGIGRNSIQETVTVARAAIRHEADALVLVTPYYMRLHPTEIMQYYDRLLEMIDFDVIAYNIPQFTGNTISSGMFEKLRERHRNLVGIKDSSKDMGNFRKLCALPDDLIIFQGMDDVLLESLRMGASGGVCGTTNFDDGAVRLFNAFISKAPGKASELQKSLAKKMLAFGKVEFPVGYHYAFYRKVMHEDAINALQPFYRNGAQYAREVGEKMRKAL